MLSLAPFCARKPQALLCKCTPGIKLIYKLGSGLFLLAHRAQIGLLLYSQGNGMATHIVPESTCKRDSMQPEPQLHGMVGPGEPCWDYHRIIIESQNRLG